MSVIDSPWTERLDRFQRPALIAGVVGLALSAGVAVVRPGVFFPAYLAAYLYWLGLGLGSLGALMLHHLVGGHWGFLIRRPAEAAAMALILMALLFLPLLLGLHTLYPWANPEEVRASPALLHKSPYLNVTWFLIRTALYFALWIGLALAMNRLSRRQDEVEEPTPTRRRQTLSGPGLVLWFLAITFAMIDWVMSTEPEWYSTIYGAMLLTGQVLESLAMLAIVAYWLAESGALQDLATPEGFHDLGNLLLAFTMLWAYMSFSQLLITWMGNLTEEIPWYLRRSHDGWRMIALLLILFHFFLPFFFLLSRERKRRGNELVRICWLILAIHFLDLCWLVLPAFVDEHRPLVPVLSPLAILAVVPAWVGIGGLWVAAFLWRLKGRPLVPLHDPLLAEVLEHVHQHEHDVEQHLPEAERFIH